LFIRPDLFATVSLPITKAEVVSMSKELEELENALGQFEKLPKRENDKYLEVFHVRYPTLFICGSNFYIFQSFQERARDVITHLELEYQKAERHFKQLVSYYGTSDLSDRFTLTHWADHTISRRRCEYHRHRTILHCDSQVLRVVRGTYHRFVQFQNNDPFRTCTHCDAESRGRQRTRKSAARTCLAARTTA
jgi:hypothetical protein